MIRFLLIALTSAASAPTPAPPVPAPQQATQQPPDGAEYWTPSADRMTFIATGISFPRQAGAVSFNRSIAFGRNNTGHDNGLIYASDNGELIASANIYLPGRADAGFSSVVTEHMIRIQSGSALRVVRRSVTAAGGRDGVAIRADYAGFRQDNEASSAAFLRVDGWIVKLRVSGPEARRADVERTMSALLAGLRFQDSHAPGAALAMTVTGDCPPTPSGPPAVLQAPPNASDAAEDAILAAGAALHSEDRPDPRGRPTSHHILPRTWCVSSRRQVGTFQMPILRTPPSPAAEDSQRSVAMALLNDGDGAIEVVERRFRNRSRFTMIWHSTGRTSILGTYDGPPTDAQITALIEGRDDAGSRARAVIDYATNGNSTVTLNVRPDAGTQRAPSSR